MEVQGHFRRAEFTLRMKTTKRLEGRLLRLTPLLALLALAATAIFRTGAGHVCAAEAEPLFSAELFEEHVRFLAAENLKGRGNTTPELEQAAEYIAEHFRRFGLRPGGEDGSYFQRFPMTAGATLGPSNSISWTGEGGPSGLEVGKDFIPFSFSANGTWEAPLVFAGYGITAPELNYDDYQAVDVAGKFVIVLRHEPQEDNPDSVFSGRQLTAHAVIVNKAINARNRGALGLILVNDLGNHSGKPDELIRLGALAGPEEMTLATLQVKAEVADQWLKRSGADVESLRKAIDEQLTPRSFALDPSVKLRVQIDVERIRRLVANVIGILPGSDPELREQAIIVGAHYDHIGLGEENSLAPSLAGHIHHGADDNASGTSALLELARVLASRATPPKRTLVLVAFAGEEAGLLGSNYYTNHPAIPLERTIAMLNMDMVGRVRDNRLFVGGTGTSPDFRALVEEVNREIGFELSYSPSGYGSSDHMSFTVREVPVLFFFSGLHADYHRPSDTWEKINFRDGARVAEFVARVVGRLDRVEEKPQFVRVAEPTGHAAAGGGGGYGPYFGSIPDFGEVEKGVRFADIREGSPAAKAGFKAGDILIEFGDKKVENLYDFTYALRSFRPGDKVNVTVLRDGAPVTREVILEERK